MGTCLTCSISKENWEYELTTTSTPKLYISQLENIPPIGKSTNIIPNAKNNEKSQTQRQRQKAGFMTYNLNDIIIRKRLYQLKEEKFLTQRIFRRISENMHYEVCKYLNNTDLLELRNTNRGGYQLASNPLLRSRIMNYFPITTHPFIYPKLTFDGLIYQRFVTVLFEQTGKMVLDLLGFHMGKYKVFSFTKLLRKIPHLIGINLGYNEIEDSGLNLLSESLRFVPNLLELGLDANKIGANGMRTLANNLRYIPYLETLSLGNNRIEKTGLEALALNLEFIPNLLKLRLNGIGNIGVQMLAENLKYIPKLERLNLESNQIGDFGAKALGKNLIYTTNLERLDLYQNDIGDLGVKYFKEFKCDKCKIHLGSNRIIRAYDSNGISIINLDSFVL